METLKSYSTIKQKSEILFIEKRSNFLALAVPITSIKEANALITARRKEHFDASHNVYAYSLKEQNYTRHSDDGEPSGTAGMPVLEVINKFELLDVLVIVTRYFGGVLLGTGGLVRAYSAAATQAILKSKVKTMKMSMLYNISMNFSEYAKLQRIVDLFHIKIESCEFTDIVLVTVNIFEDYIDGFFQNINNAFNRQVTPTYIDTSFSLWEQN